MNDNFMKRAIDLSVEAVRKKGGPFGCVIVKNAISSIFNYKINPILDAPATPEKILISINKIKEKLL